jgi:hypothetical protein
MFMCLAHLDLDIIIACARDSALLMSTTYMLRYNANGA